MRTQKKIVLLHLFSLLICAAALALSSACGLVHPEQARELPLSGGNTEMGRADPGYIQYLEKQSMLSHTARLTPLVSGTNLLWRGPFAAPAPLIQSADVWLHMHPQNVLSSAESGPLRQMANPVFWLALKKMGIQGLYIAPTGGSGGLWSNENRFDLGSNDDIIQFSFAKTVGSEDDYAHIIKQAEGHKMLLGGDILPAAGGLGPDFFLASRNVRNYPGLFCMIEVPRDLWNELPDAGNNEWSIYPLDPGQVTALTGKGFIASAMRQEKLPFLPGSGWAATGEALGMDGNTRRWIYRYAYDYRRPVFNIYDPGRTAMQAFSGSAIYQLGILGNSLAGMQIAPLFGLEGKGSNTVRLADDANYAAAFDLASDISRQISSYGKYSWIRDELPLPILHQLMQNGPDLARDSVTSPAAEHALLSGNTRLLEFLLDEALMLEIDFSRLIHGSSASGVDYALTQLSYLQADKELVNAPSNDVRSGLAANLMFDARDEAREVSAKKLDTLEQSLFDGNMLYSTPAGLAAMAMGLQGIQSVTPEEAEKIRRGHMLLLFFKAMQPGVWMLGGQDLAGSLPLQEGLMQKKELWHKKLAAMGTFPLLTNSESFLVSSLGIPKAKNLYGPLDAQMSNPYSALDEIAQIIKLRGRLGISSGEFTGYLRGRENGLVIMVTRLPQHSALAREGRQSPEDPVYALAISNFSQEEREEIIELAELSALAPIAKNAVITQIYGDTGRISAHEGRMLFIAPGWSKTLVLIQPGQGVRESEPELPEGQTPEQLPQAGQDPEPALQGVEGAQESEQMPQAPEQTPPRMQAPEQEAQPGEILEQKPQVVHKMEPAVQGRQQAEQIPQAGKMPEQTLHGAQLPGQEAQYVYDTELPPQGGQETEQAAQAGQAAEMVYQVSPNADYTQELYAKELAEELSELREYIREELAEYAIITQ